MDTSAADDNSDEPLTPVGRLLLQPEMNQIIHCAMGFKNSIDIGAVKSHLKTSLLLSHPRFSSLMLRDSRGLQHWHNAPNVDLDRHIIVIHNPVTTSPVDHETAVNEYLADLSTSSTRLSANKPLWELHLLMAHNCGIFRIHHALGDGVSVMSLFLESFRTRGSNGNEEKILGRGRRKRVNGEKGWWGLLIRLVEMLWFSLVFLVENAMRSLWLCDQKTAISGGDGVELWPRKLATARFRLEDMKLVKKAVPNATINDVLVGVVSSGLSRYLDHQTPNALHDGFRITGLAMVNLREQPGLQVSNFLESNSESSWGNKFGMFLLPIYYHKSSDLDPLVHLKRAKLVLDRKKQSLEADFSYKVGCFLITYFGAKVASWLLYRMVCNTSFTISNIIGPQEAIAIGGNLVTYLRVNTCSLPQALTMHMVSYAERADLQILVAKDIIPDPTFLAKCFEEALLDMKEAASSQP
ncbi:wax ester synthase/diacylglycerol acyltransferase 5 isoform X2 [Pyrus x bretschneideri]|uniref:wax ester synthase/diacylglycerol acyltransferase 5 isoform X2 n=1 Tax=Pyrus x bretschneideri TaxID=225117 RepID=UPI00202EB11E|nr:wax ester synthase/diacylglycerol acyltransferase 5 isoform X2 [Pyrus x bretschneideri]